MAIPIFHTWKNYFSDPDEGLGSSYERIVLNKKLQHICQTFQVKNCLEVPTFGFTGISGINSMQLAKNGINVHLVDHDNERLKMIKNIWKQQSLSADFTFVKNYQDLSFEKDQFDLSWNFSALWLISDLNIFLTSLTKFTKKVIFLCVPNRSGLGYLSQKYLSEEKIENFVNEANIIPKKIISIMKELDWKLFSSDYIDCPPWPDIGMSKEDFLQKFSIKMNKKTKENDPLTILDYYRDKKPDFAEKMLRFYWWEKIAPNFIKFFWAHHRFLLFIPQKTKK